MRLSSEKTASVLASLRDRYDRIIVDTTPILGLVDPLSLQGSVDAVVLVVRSDSTTNRDMIAARELFKRSSVPVIGFVLNDIDMNSLENSYYYESYYPNYYENYYSSDGEISKQSST